MKAMRVVLVSVALLNGCEQQHVEKENEPKGVLGFEDVRSSIVGEDGWVTTFVSREGKFEGMDSDSEITFRDGGRVQMTEYGYAPTGYSGTYTVNEQGVISASFDDYPGEWPKMILREVSGRILLFRFDAATELEFGGRGGAVETADMKPFWPFGPTEMSWERPKPETDSSEGDNGVFPILPGLELDEGESSEGDSLPERNEE